MAQLKAPHEFHVVYLVETLVPFEHGLPCPLVGVGVGLLNLAAEWKYYLLLAVDGVFRVCTLLTHSVALLAGVTLQVVVVILIAELSGELQVLQQFQLCVKPGEDGAVLAHLGGVGTLLEDIEVRHFVLSSLYVGVVVVAAVGIIRLEVWVYQARVINGVGKTACIGHVTFLLALVGEDGSTYLQHVVDLEVCLERKVVAVVLHSLHITFLVVVAK